MSWETVIYGHSDEGSEKREESELTGKEKGFEWSLIWLDDYTFFALDVLMVNMSAKLT